IGDFLPAAALLGRRTAELHLALARGGDDPGFRPEAFTPLHQRALYQSMRGLTAAVYESLRLRAPDLPRAARTAARAALERQDTVLERFHAILDGQIEAQR